MLSTLNAFLPNISNNGHYCNKLVISATLFFASFAIISIKDNRLQIIECRSLWKNNLSDIITDLLRYWSMLEIFGGNALQVEYHNRCMKSIIAGSILWYISLLTLAVHLSFLCFNMTFYFCHFNCKLEIIGKQLDQIRDIIFLCFCLYKPTISLQKRECAFVDCRPHALSQNFKENLLSVKVFILNLFFVRCLSW